MTDTPAATDSSYRAHVKHLYKLTTKQKLTTYMILLGNKTEHGQNAIETKKLNGGTPLATKYDNREYING